MDLNSLEDNKVRPTPIIERRKEWEHGEEGKGKDCYRANKPVYTPENKSPDECHSCDNTKYYSKGIVEREKGTKKILTRDGKKVE